MFMQKRGGGGVHNFITSSLVLSLVNKAHLTKVITKGTPNALSRTCDMFQKSSHAKSFSFHKNHSTLKHYVLRALQFDGFTEVWSTCATQVSRFLCDQQYCLWPLMTCACIFAISACLLCKALNKKYKLSTWCMPNNSWLYATGSAQESQLWTKCGLCSRSQQMQA